MSIVPVIGGIGSTPSVKSANWSARISRHMTSDGSVIVSPRIAAWLDAKAAVTSDRRIRVRETDPEAYEVLTALRLAALVYGSGNGTNPQLSQQIPGELETWLTTVEAGRRLGITDRAVRKRITAGQLAATLYGGRWLLNPRHVHAAQVLGE